MSTFDQQSKIRLLSLYKENPGLAFLQVIEILRKEAFSSISKDFEDFKKDVSKDVLKYSVELLKKEGIKGDPGIPAKPEDVAKLLCKSKKFIELTKGKEGYSPTKKDVANIALEIIPKLIPPPKEGTPGKTPTQKELLDLIKPLIPELPKLKFQTSKELEDIIIPIIKSLQTNFQLNGKDVVEKINALPLTPDCQIDASHIKNLPRPKKEKSTGRIGRGTGNATKYYDLSDFLNGVTKTFTIPANVRVLDVRSNSAPIAFRQTTDYTHTTSSITFTSEVEASTTLAAGQTVYIIYVEA